MKALTLSLMCLLSAPTIALDQVSAESPDPLECLGKPQYPVFRSDPVSLQLPNPFVQ